MPVLQSFVSPEEVYPEREVTYADVAAIAATLNQTECLKFLGFLNLLMSAATTETHLTNNLKPIHEVQTWLFREVVSEKLLTDLKRTFRNASLLDRPILHRTQLLFAIRLVATHGVETGGNTLSDRSDFDVVGDLLFLVSGLLRPDPLTSDAATALWVATHTAPLHELENPPTIELSWPRIDELLTQRLPAVAANLEELERLEQVTVFTTGFNIRAWIDLTYMLFAYWGTVPFRDLMSNQSRAYLDPNKEHEVISSEMLSRAVEGIGIPFDQVPELLKIDTFSRTLLFDLTPFRTKPLWRMPDGLVLCVDAGLLMERLGPHVFWSVINALDTPARRKQFSSTWGYAFESYCLDALGSVFRGKKWTYSRNPVDEGTNEEFCDAVAHRDDTAILIECKGTFITSADKYSGVPGRFFRGVSQKFGHVPHGGVYQLVRGISRQWFLRSARGVLPRTDGTGDVFPILIVQDPAAACGPVSRVLSDRMIAAIGRLSSVKHKTPTIWPLTVLSADELDLISAAVQSTSQRLDSILKRFHRAHPSRMIPIGEFLWSGANADFGFPDKVQAVVRKRFDAMTAAVVQRFRDGEYGGTMQPDEEL